LVLTDSIVNFTSEKIIVSGKVIDIGEGIDEFGHCWSKSPFPNINDNKAYYTNLDKRDYFTSEISSLEKGCIYYVRAYARNNHETVYGNTFVILVEDKGVPEVQTTDVSLLADGSIEITGKVISSGRGTILYKGICFDTLPNPTFDNVFSITFDISNNISMKIYQSQYKINKIYYFRAYAVNELGIGYGKVIEFKTTITD
jgi:hypothetical protein